MGTRNLTIVKFNGEVKVAQYGQWDGYPTGQGQTIADFLKEKVNIEKLKKNISKVRFIEPEGKDKDFLTEYNKNAPRWSSDPDNRTDEQKRWFNTYRTRDLGASILQSIANSEDEEILLNNEIDFKKDGLLCEYWYEIDLDKETVVVNGSKPYSFKQWTRKGFMEKLEDTDG